jgi:hypothetical protein
MVVKQGQYDDNQYGAAEGDAYPEGQDGGEEYYDDDDEHTFTVDEPEQGPNQNLKMDQGFNGANDVQGVSQSPSTADLNEPTGPRGVKRKETPDDRRIDADATTALLVSDLHWWTTEDDLRGWINESNAEHDLKDVSFNEHKVNGKSKGQVYLEFLSLQSSTAAKHKIESLTEGPNNTRTFVVAFNSPSSNPFKTISKDAPPRGKEERYGRGGAYNSAPPRGEYSNSSFRGRGRGSYDRGGYNNQNFNRNFSGPAGGFNNSGYQNNMGMMNSFGFNRGSGMMGNNTRGNMGGMRGGRGGMNSMMPMNMGNMNPMMAGMGMHSKSH